MPYHEQSFLDGLISGLAATAGRPMGPLEKALVVGTDTFMSHPIGTFETIVSKMKIQTHYPLTIVYEYGPDRDNPERVFRRIPALNRVQTICHVLQLPEPLKITEYYPRSLDYYYNVSYFRRGPRPSVWSFDYETPWGGLMLYPVEDRYHKWHFYPGSPELVDEWLVQSNWIHA
ncbi:MAG: hypothetical protein IJQ25_03285 [Oscillibacter sp.]|nr:hypothetical protein [Oscillibacter sp.]